MIPSPFLLYIGSAADPADIKTSRGMATFRREDCVGELRHDDSPLTLGLPRLTMAEAARAGARTLVLGIAVAGGRLNEALIADALAAIAAGLNVASGLHHRLRDQPALREAAEAAGVALFDVRDPPPDLPVGNGRKRAGKRLLTVGTDCSTGKMFTTLALANALRERGVAADFRATGQTGILIAGSGIPLDAVVADFIAGAIETLSPARGDDGWDLIEGQGSLFHPAFAGVSTGLLHGAQPDAIVMCHDPARPHLRGLPHYPLPELGRCLEENLRVAALTNPAVQAVGIALNTSRLGEEEALRLCEETARAHGLACTDPHRFGAGAIVDALLTRVP
jgi:uncharacterized NAD-dependent epimerase/dehydratase family protein